MKNVTMIAAVGQNRELGKDNKLLWNLPADMKRFKEITSGHVIIMGRKTFESIGKVLPNRKHIIFSQNRDLKYDDENVEVVHSMLEIKEYIDNDEENFVIGGAMIYNLLMPHVTKMYVTQVNKDFEGDAFFPKINEDIWEVVEEEKGLRDEESKLEFEYITYVRK